jgi:hypothetical protein
MKIKSRTSALVATEKDGVLASIPINPGEHEYPELNPKDKRTAEDLRMLRDGMGLIEFDSILPGDKERAEEKKEIEDTRKAFKKEHAERQAKRKEERAEREAKKAKKELEGKVADVREASTGNEGAGEDDAGNSRSGGVSGEGADPGSARSEVPERRDGTDSPK